MFCSENYVQIREPKLALTGSSPNPKLWSRKGGFSVFLLLAVLGVAAAAVAAPIRVVVWDERQQAQKSAYGGFLGDTLAATLARQPDFSVKSVGLNDPDQGLTDEILDQCDVLIWWGHQKHQEVTDEHVGAIMRRLKEGRLSLIALHSAHWSKPFVAAMNERALDDALQTVPESERAGLRIVQIQPNKSGLPGLNDPLTPSFRRYKAQDGADTLEVKLPACLFPIVNNEGKPSHIHTRLPQHPIAAAYRARSTFRKRKCMPALFMCPNPTR